MNYSLKYSCCAHLSIYGSLGVMPNHFNDSIKVTQKHKLSIAFAICMEVCDLIWDSTYAFVRQ